MRQLLSCSNCWFNVLQSGSIGLSVGYCVQHEVVLRQADELTCGRHVRKDLLLDSALATNKEHRKVYETDGPRLVTDGTNVGNGEYVERSTDLLRKDDVGEVVADYGEYGTKIESLAQLRTLPGIRAEIAMTCLARGYTKRCCDRGGRWTSGVHLLWWTRRRLEEEPKPKVELADLRYQLPVALKRQVELATWWVMMLRLIFISDVGSHARSEGHPISKMSDLAERAAADTEIPSVRKLATWIRKTALPELNEALPEGTYRKLARELRQESPGAN